MDEQRAEDRRPATGSVPGERDLSRRDVLRSALAGSMALAVPGLLAGAERAQAAAPADTPKRGGRLRVGMVGGGSSETLNPVHLTNEIDIARGHILYERLTDFNPDGSLYNRLAAEFSPNSDGSVWKMKVRPGVVFHDGSPLTAQDVVYSLQYILNPANNAPGKSQIAYMTSSGIRALDASTVQFTLAQPNALVPSSLSSREIWIFKNDTTDFSKPNGTGPFKYKSFTPGERSLFTRHDRYWVPGRPYLDELEIISINDATTRLNALIAGQIDAMGYLDPTLVSTVTANPNLRLLQHAGGGYSSQFMRLDMAPFTDNRVRQAFRYMVDRQQVLKAALLGYGKLGNDLACPFDPDYAAEIPQRPYDPEKARFLLKQAGQSNLTISLYTGDPAPGMLASSIVIAEQAKKVGVTITLNKVPADQYWNNYLKPAFSTTNWGQRPLDSQISEAFNIGAPENETHWMRADFDKITAQARRTLDHQKRHALWVEAQRMLWNEGGYIIWGFLSYLDATSSKVHGIVPSSARPLGWYTFTDAYLA